MLVFKKKNTGRPIRDHFTAEFDGNSTGKLILKVWVFGTIAAVIIKYIESFFR
jgi:hypothetical protein